MSTSALPQPLVPAEVDLRDFGHMPLDVQRVRDSDLASEETPEACWAALLLWCAAWHQVPAGSIPDSDNWQAKHTGYKTRGKIDKEWPDVRDGALRNFVRCADGRMYHPVVAEKALEAWSRKLRHHYDRARDRLRKANKARPADGQLPEFSFEQWNEARIAAGVPMEKADASAGIPTTVPPAQPGIPPENTLKGEGQGEGEGEGQGEGDLKRKRKSSSTHRADPRDGPPEDDPTAPPATKAGLVGQAFKRAGIAPTSCNFSDPVFAELLRQGATVEEFEGLAQEAITKRISHPWPWVLKTLQARRADAAALRLPAQANSQAARSDKVAEAAKHLGFANQPDAEVLDA